MTINTEKYNRKCAECSVREDQIALFEILLPPEITSKTPYCRKCLDVIIDNSIRKNREKSREINN